MQERQLFQGLIKAGGIFLMVKGIYLHSLWFFDSQVHQRYLYYNWLTPSIFIIMGILLLLGSVAITHFAYGNNYSQWSLASIMRIGIKLLGVWLIYQQFVVLASVTDNWIMGLLPEITPSMSVPYWIIHIAVGIAAISAGLVLLRYQPKLTADRGGF
ncbi:MAG TPA: hypothetical protein PKO32_02525 [Syntrophomonadaceae bacterium]|nr:hypothetical protein [Syntrophomonadaceae bacterium]HQA07660.1 hypothetical protein [Syntrophomonadaceae bacterium]